jgi:hypothetical protein
MVKVKKDEEGKKKVRKKRGWFISSNSDIRKVQIPMKKSHTSCRQPTFKSDKKQMQFLSIE